MKHLQFQLYPTNNCPLISNARNNFLQFHLKKDMFFLKLLFQFSFKIEIVQNKYYQIALFLWIFEETK